MKPSARATVVLSLPFEIATSVIAGLLLGLWADRRFHTSPLFILIGLGLGLCATVVLVLRVSRTAAMVEDTEQSTKDQTTAPPSDPADRTP